MVEPLQLHADGLVMHRACLGRSDHVRALTAGPKRFGPPTQATRAHQAVRPGASGAGASGALGASRMRRGWSRDSLAEGLSGRGALLAERHIMAAQDASPVGGVVGSGRVAGLKGETPASIEAGVS